MKRFLFLLFVCMGLGARAQQNFYFPGTTWPVHVQLQELAIPSFPAFHSGAVGSHDGKWIIIGGRTNGLHGFYPPFAFPANGVQNRIYVADPVAGSVWSSDMDALPQPLQEQLKSSNMQACVNGGKMYISGGYGYSATVDDYVTFPYLTEVDMPALIQAVVAGTSPAAAFKYTNHPQMAVTGGRMSVLNNRFYLFFGHKFTGRYSTTPGANFDQTYSYQLRMFNVGALPDSIEITNYSAITDSSHFRRRDLNVTPYKRNGAGGTDTLGFMAWSGVFKADVDRPHTDQVFIRPDGGYSVIPIEQKYNQYHSAFVPVRAYGASGVSVIFFGGMAENKVNTTAVDTLVPFVKNAAIITEANGGFGEFGSPDTLSGYWGTNAEFIPTDEFLDAQTGILEMNIGFCFTPKLLGYIIGGIESTGPNISSSNDPSLSLASAKIYKVYAEMLCEDVQEYNIASVSVYPNPTADAIRVKAEQSVVRWEVMDITGKIMLQQKGNDTHTLDVSMLQPGTYFVKIFTAGNMLRSTFIKL